MKAWVAEVSLSSQHCARVGERPTTATEEKKGNVKFLPLNQGGLGREMEMEGRWGGPGAPLGIFFKHFKFLL